MSVRKFGAGQSVKRVEDVRLDHGTGPLSPPTPAKAPSSRPLSCAARYAPRALHDRRSRRRPRHAGRPRRLHRRGLRRARRSAVPRAGREFRRLADPAEALSGDGGRRGRPCRRHRRHGRRRDRCRRRATPPRRSRSTGRSLPAGRRHGGAVRPARRWSSTARPATSPTTRISATRPRPTPSSPRRRARRRSRSSTRASSPITWSRAPRAPTSTRRRARSRWTLGSQGVHVIKTLLCEKILKIPPTSCASSPRTSAAASAPRT